MKICFIDVLGLCYDGSTTQKRGLGGSESAVIYMSRELAKIGFDVTVFNDCVSDDAKPGVYDGVLYRDLKEVEISSGYDVVIGLRSVAAFSPPEIRERFKSFLSMPNFDKIMSTSRWKILWMHDTFCDGDDLIEDYVLQGRINEIFTLSDWHTSYITTCHHGKRRNFEVLKRHIWQTRNGINNYIDWVDISQKDPNLFVFNASFTKGMVALLTRVWPRVKQHIPQAQLVVIGGYYRFRSDHGPDEQEKNLRQMMEIYKDSVRFTDVITQKEIANILTKASFMIYPAAFPETFGISSLEALNYNTPLITCTFGALEETAIDMACYKIPYAIEPNALFPDINPETQADIFAQTVIMAHRNTYLHQQKMYACNQVKGFCEWKHVALQWKQHFFSTLGGFLPVEEYRLVTRINQRVRKVFGRRFCNNEDITISKNEQRKICVITPVYNAENYIHFCINSVASQDYDNYEMYIIDDASTDRTKNVIFQTIKNLPEKLKEKFNIILNDKNIGAVFNQINTIRTKCKENSIVILLDGDDWLVNDPTIFHKYNNIYKDGAEFTYGSCWSLVDNIPLIAQPYPPDVKKTKTYRQHKFNWNMPYTHLRTFSRHLLDAVSDEMFKDENGKWLRAGGDTAVFYNLIEQADPNKVVCVPDIVYNYNDANPLNDYKINSDEQTKNASRVIEGNKTMTKKKILIGIPTARYIEPETFLSIYNLEIPEGYETTFQYFYGYNVDQVRNLIADWAVKGYDYLFSVDHDISFAPDTLKKLLNHNKPIVSGVYRQRFEHVQILEVYDKAHRNLSYEEIEGKGLVEIGGCGFGCVLVKKEVLESVGYPQFEYHSALDHRNTFSEDLDFCKKARAKGYTLWADTSILCGHYGQKTFYVEAQKKTFELAPEIAIDTIQERFEYLNAENKMPDEFVGYMKQLKDKISPKVAYDIGACVLHWTEHAKQIWNDAEYIAFEAMTDVEPLYKKKGVRYNLGPLSDIDGKVVDFYENLENPAGNSIYRENSEYADVLYPEDKKKKTIAMTLDTVVKNNGFPLPDLMKIDVQGSELDILKGATECLMYCKDIFIEMQHEEYNKGAPHKDEVVKYLQRAGFVLLNEINKGPVDGDYHFKKEIRKRV